MTVLTLAGCSRGATVHPFSLYEYESKPRSFDMPAHFREIEQLYVPIALIDSAPREVVNDQAREEMLKEIKEAARKMGADAIHKVQFVKGSNAGYIPDPATPFPSLKQGSLDETYLRGEAVKFPDPNRPTVQRFQAARGTAASNPAMP